MAKAPTDWHQSKLRNLMSTQKHDRRIGTYPSHLRGMATNRYGGNNLQHERGLSGGTYGPADLQRVHYTVSCLLGFAGGPIAILLWPAVILTVLLTHDFARMRRELR